MRNYAVIAAILFVVGIGTSFIQAQPITTGSLVREMIDLRRLTDFPNPAYKTVQFSSYDRRSSVPGGPDWFSNSDGFGKEPIPNFEAVLRKPEKKSQDGEYLICDVKGPGAIVRVWSARMLGTIRLYLDDAEQPVFEGDSEEFLQRTWYRYAREAGIKDKILDNTFRQREAGYYPIPFAKRCRIEWSGQIHKVHFYQVQIRLYEPSARVVTFQPSDLKTYKADIEAVAKVLAAPNKQWPYRSSEQPIPISAQISPGEQQHIFKLRDTTKAIERLTLKITAQDLDRALRQTILRIRFDDYDREQVECPIGDFFGAAPGINPYDSVPFTVEPDGTQTCRFVMPFKDSIRVSLDNRGKQPVTVDGSALLSDYTWNDKTSMHFRARWRVDHDLVSSNERIQDIPFLIANGRGVYVGTASILLNPAPIPAGGGSWWGEGDEKIFVDDDTSPSTYGTGSEDYYNYAWSSPDIFIFPYCGQPRNDGPVNRGFVTNHRWHVLDPLPFKNRIAFYMELSSHDPTPGFSYARIAYHYGHTGLMDDHLPITDADVRHLELPMNWQPEARRGAKNSVFYAAEELLDTLSNVTFREGNLFAGGRVCIWQPAKQGDELTLKVPVLEDGNYIIRLTMLLDRQSGTFSATLDGKKIGFGGESGVIDLFRPHRTLLRMYGSNRTELKKGDHRLVLRFEGPGANEGGREIGVDFLGIQKK